MDSSGGATGWFCYQALTTQHPLQPFSRDYFPPRTNGVGDGEETQPKPPLADVLQARGGLFTYEREWRSAHAVDNPEQSREALPYQTPEEPISLTELANFLKKPSTPSTSAGCRYALKRWKKTTPITKTST